MKLSVVGTLVALASQAMGRATAPGAVVPRDFNPNRLASDRTWSDFQCKGERLVGAMRGSEQDAARIMGLPNAQSPWAGDMRSGLQIWGYTEQLASSMNCDFINYWAVGTAFNYLRLDPRPRNYGGPNLCYNFQHWDLNKKDAQGNVEPKRQQTYQAYGKTYRVTGAEMQISINPVGGAVFMQYVTSPQTAAMNLWNRRPALDELPYLRHLSDIMWGAWNRDNGNIANIRYFWVQGVGNSNTKSVIARALRNVGKNLERWPGTTLNISDRGALAILGSENGACFGFFLAQHKRELGNKVITHVQIFKNDRDSNPDPDLLFYVGNA